MGKYSNNNNIFSAENVAEFPEHFGINYYAIKLEHFEINYYVIKLKEDK